MKQFTQRLIISTQKKRELIKITSEIEDIIKKSKIKEGVCFVFLPHATASLLVNEDEEGLKEDIWQNIDNLFPSNINYRHNQLDNNAEAHLINVWLGSNRVFLVSGNKLERGTWQEIFLLENDGPRSNRQLIVKIMGE